MPNPLWDYIELRMGERGFTQADLARAAGVSPSQISKLRKRPAGPDSRPGAPMLSKIAVALGRPAAEIMAVASGQAPPERVRHSEAAIAAVQRLVGMTAVPVPLVTERAQLDAVRRGDAPPGVIMHYYPDAGDRDHAFVAVLVDEEIPGRVHLGHWAIVDLDAAPAPGDVVLVDLGDRLALRVDHAGPALGRVVRVEYEP